MSSRNLASVLSRLSEFGAQTDQFLKQEITAAAFQIEHDAKENASTIQNAPAEVKQLISHEILNDGFTAVVKQNALPIGAYIEFGTGVYVKVAREWKDMAWQFYVNGKGTLPATPYMYPAYTKARKDLIKIINSKIDQLTRNFNRP